MERYFISVNGQPEREVSVQEWMDVERQAGLTSQHKGRPATAGFSGMTPSGIVRGKVRYSH